MPDREALPAPSDNRPGRDTGGVSAEDALNAVTLIVTAVRDTIALHKTENTKRQQLSTYRETELARIAASERTLRTYFDHFYADRRETNKLMFEQLAAARQAGDVQAMQTCVSGIVELARISPLANVGELSDIRRAIGDPTAVVDL